MLKTEFVGKVTKLDNDTVHLAVGDGTSQIPFYMLSETDQKTVKIGDTVTVKIRKESQEDTGEWTIKVLSPSRYAMQKGDNPAFTERFDQKKKK